MKKSKSVVVFNDRLNKVMTPELHHTGFYTDNLTLTTDLIQYLKTRYLYEHCTRVIHVLHKGTMIPQRELKPFISVTDIKTAYLNYIDEQIHLKQED